MKKILLLGATGRIGRIVLNDLSGNDVIIRAYVRSPEKMEKGTDAEVIRGDILDTVSLHGVYVDRHHEQNLGGILQ